MTDARPALLAGRASCFFNYYHKEIELMALF
jgi:hypothetical protein